MQPGQSMHRNPQWGPELQKFHDLTHKKLAGRRDLQKARIKCANAQIQASRGRSHRGALTRNPYATGKRNPKPRFGTGMQPNRPTARGPGSHEARTLKVIDGTAGHLPRQEASSRYSVSLPATWSRVQKAALVVWDTVWDLERRVPESDFLKCAIVVVAAGMPVLGKAHWGCAACENSRHVLTHTPACLQPANLLLGPELQSKHKALCQWIERCPTLPGSKWKVMRQAPAPDMNAPVTMLSSLDDVRGFLLRARRLKRAGGLGGRYFPTSGQPVRRLGFFRA